MGIYTGIVKGQTIASYRGSPNVRLLQVQLLGDNPETVEFINVTGEDTAPSNGDRVVVFDVAGGYKVTLGSKSLITEAVLQGEKKLYSHLNGSLKAFIYFLNNGNLELNGNADFAVRFNELQTAFNQLKTDHDNLLAELKLHTHPGVTTGGSSTGPPVLSSNPSTANINPAKVDTVKLP